MTTRTPMSKKKIPIITGNVYVGQVPDGRYGAIRVLRVADRSSLIYACDYLGSTPPDLADPSLRKCLAKNRFSWKGQSAIWWAQGAIPTGLSDIGHVPLTKTESATECNVYGYWDSSSIHEAYLEWRWAHDRVAFEQERAIERAQEAERERLRALQQKPKKMMQEDEFWAIIALLDWSKTGDDDLVMAPAIDALAKLGKKAIHAFEERLSFLLYQIDTKEHAKHIGTGSYQEPDGYISADGFLYARCVVVANGRGLYEKVLATPTAMPKDMEFESLLGLANAAHVLRYDNDMDYVTGCNRESFSNLVGWEKT